ncbi:methylated-DNA-[protein]-cysteine S-methyltransferase [Paenibacillus cellulosilyticus]|uniref:methylated-DNA--[protein]-cysteine S-methyltransferase n=1 Tax=Paenibacillus cellulosilyticus TaxID=375489 RepID=A0A2V2YU11_9BACL|nr:methylated-DNA--[protein]-cysteine S-methyltransferase [Paenibacillus cellulosilyticus]PWW02905.1 methylated-DNA-[protein]-cysteine S-methyltransferase [Paenibacillus cellulosilyticus]QKS45815.1 methylated-DNA--[protein]-cysteine S-methyltransferase [Paenibacillus cellulosilyticus]
MTTSNRKILYWSLLSHEGWRVHIAAVDEGLCFVGSQEQTVEELTAWADRRMPGYEFMRDDEKLQPYADELIRYFKGGLEQFTSPLYYQGTPFQEAVWKALCEIPYGQTCSYSDIATRIQKPASVRAVGTAIGANPILITVPCHRVIGKNGSLSGYRGGIEMKTKLLELERRL